jgi:hypothetical protein
MHLPAGWPERRKHLGEGSTASFRHNREDDPYAAAGIAASFVFLAFQSGFSDPDPRIAYYENMSSLLPNGSLRKFKQLSRCPNS